MVRWVYEQPSSWVLTVHSCHSCIYVSANNFLHSSCYLIYVAVVGCAAVKTIWCFEATADLASPEAIEVKNSQDWSVTSPVTNISQPSMIALILGTVSTLSSAQISSNKFKSVQIRSAQISSVQIRSAHISSVQLRSVQLKSVQISSDQLSSAQITSVQISSVQIISVHLSFV